MDTVNIEKKAFLVRLCSDPVFLLMHAGSLMVAVCGKVRNRLRAGLRPKHRGAKEWPVWLDPESRVVRRMGASAAIAGTLPLYHLSPARNPNAAPEKMLANSVVHDSEEYFLGQRWRFLLEALFEESVDWQKGLNEAMRWVETHRDKDDMAWEPYSTCERVSNLLVFLSAMPVGLREKCTTPRLLEFLDESVEWIYGHIEYYGSSRTNNHILNNARALVLAGVVLGDGSALLAGMRIFRQCLPLLIMRGGFLRERSSHYQLIVLGWVLDAWRFIVADKRQSSDDAEFLRSYIERMIDAAHLLCRCDGRLAACIGDVSPDLTPAQSLARLSRLYPEFWPVTGKSARHVELKDGWFRLCSEDDVILGNFPPGIYPPQFPTHGHCDLTSFAWLHHGEEILIDSGRHRYTPDAVSMFQKSAVGHNLPIVNGFSPLSETLIAQSLWWPRPYASAFLEVTDCGRGVLLVHDGLARATAVSRHSRKIVPEGNGIIVVDSFDGQGEVDVAFCWHFGSGFDTFDEKRLTATGAYGEVKLSVNGVVGLPRVEPLSGREPGGWISRIYGEMRPALGVSLRWRARLPAVISTRFAVAPCAA